MTSLYTHKESNIRKTWLIFTLFCVVVIGFGYIFTQIFGDPGILYGAVGLSVIMSVGSYWFSDKLVLRMANAKPIQKQDAPELYRLVENLSITAGLPMPKVYIVADPSPNAFATGRNPEHSVVAVTTGLLERLDKVELEGVLAHELSHIGNRDMLISTMVVVLVGFISILSDMFNRWMWWGGGRDNENRGNNTLFIFLGLALAILAPLAATLMQLAISRKREFLADASGALLTRHPEGLARALEKIHRDHSHIRVASNTTAHLWLEDPFTDQRHTHWLHKLFMTHPPMEERIRALRGMDLQK